MASVLGVNLAAGVAYLAVVEEPDIVVHQKHQKVEPPTNAQTWDRVRRFGDGLVAAAKACGAVQVVFAGPKKFEWSYSDAFVRMSLHTGAALALEAAGVPTSEMSQMTASSRLGFGNRIKLMEAEIAQLLGLDPKQVVHWEKRRAAFCVAKVAAKGLWP